MKNTLNPILIAGPTASGKSQIALRIAQHEPVLIVNADALQVFSCWRVLTARPTDRDLITAPHALYGHVGSSESYSVGTWLREIAGLLETSEKRLVIVGGTGLYLTRITSGLAWIPPILDEIRAAGNALRQQSGAAAFLAYLSAKDPVSLAQLDKANPMRLQRAWEVHQQTGIGLAQWHKTPHNPLIDSDNTKLIVLDAPTEWLDTRIARRLDLMIDSGALDECRAFMANGWDPALQSAKALGAKELISVLRGSTSLENARAIAIVKTRQYAKRQRTWFRNNMSHWQQLPAWDLPSRLEWEM